jgi:hypothetical protein
VRKDVRIAFEATVQVNEQRGRVTIGKEVPANSSRVDGISIDEKSGKKMQTDENTTMRVGRYRDASGDIDDLKVISRAIEKIKRSPEKHQQDTGLVEHLFVWLKGDRSDTEGGRIAKIWKDEGRKRGIGVTVGSLSKFLKSGNALKSTFGAVVGIFAALRGTPAEAAPKEGPGTDSTQSDSILPSAQETREAVIDMAIPDEVQQLVQFAELALKADELAPHTATKAFELAYAHNQNLRRIAGLPFAIDIHSGELFGLTESVLNTNSSYPGALTSLGSLNGIPGVFFLSQDSAIGFQRDSNGEWGMYASVDGRWEKISR